MYFFIIIIVKQTFKAFIPSKHDFLYCEIKKLEITYFISVEDITIASNKIKCFTYGIIRLNGVYITIIEKLQRTLLSRST